MQIIVKQQNIFNDITLIGTKKKNFMKCYFFENLELYITTHNPTQCVLYMLYVTL